MKRMNRSTDLHNNCARTIRTLDLKFLKNYMFIREDKATNTFYELSEAVEVAISVWLRILIITKRTEKKNINV